MEGGRLHKGVATMKIFWAMAPKNKKGEGKVKEECGDWEIGEKRMNNAKM